MYDTKETVRKIMDEILESYHIDTIEVNVTTAGRAGRYHIDCTEGKKHLGFDVKESEYKNYKRLMNQRIRDAFKRRKD